MDSFTRGNGDNRDIKTSCPLFSPVKTKKFEKEQTMKPFLMSIALTIALVFVSIADFLPESPLRLGFVSDAEAIIGLPRTPFSVAGVARRSMYREAAVVTTAAVATSAAATTAAAESAATAAAAQKTPPPAAAVPVGTVVPSCPLDVNQPSSAGSVTLTATGFFIGPVFRETTSCISYHSPKAMSDECRGTREQSSVNSEQSSVSATR
jgi:hypothetical protein